MKLCLLNLLNTELEGNFLSVLKSMYSMNSRRVRDDTEHGLTEAFLSIVGVYQGDNLSPNLFNIFLNDIVDQIRFYM